jgi:transcriptional regulator with XRE-family HTH domain
MSIAICEKLALIRESERMNKKEFAGEIGVVYTTYVSYELGRSTPSAEILMRILSHQKFKKYTMWFMTGDTTPEAGQIAPVLAHSGPNATTSPHSDQKTG